MRLDDSIYEFIKEEAVDLLVRFDIKSIPIQGAELAKKMGIILRPYSTLDNKKLLDAQLVSQDGFYMEPGNGKEYIFYNDKKSKERCNMTILHEIGHAVLGHFDNTNPEIAEAEAAFFAKYIIAPPPLIHKFHPACPEEIAGLFCISYEASFYTWKYYCKWRMFHKELGKFTVYEMKLNKLYGIIA